MDGTCDIYLVRHSETRPDPDRPSSTWELTPDGHAAALSLKGVLPDVVFSSPEPKALQTARHLTNLPITIVEEFREHRADKNLWLSKVDFAASVERYFCDRSNPVWGETHDEAVVRFKRGLRKVLSQNRNRSQCTIVTHGRILCSFIGALDGNSGYEMWKGLTMPAVVKLEIRGNAIRTQTIQSLL